MSKFLDLLNGITTTAPPAPYRIDWVALGGKSVIVHCDRRREMYEVAEFVKSQRSGSWMAGFWLNVLDAPGANPYEVSGTWIYLMVQA